MAHYAYKHVIYDIDYEAFKKYEEEFEKEVGRESDGDSNYNGDNWYVVELWIRDLIAKNKELEKKLKHKQRTGN